ncbi:tyrosine-type recombinase/integrase [Mycolicibacterium pulveris]|uniref:tyrosine-type recombinase/integrase n=1 Tax=Mycolicibacterium pulveris TaxID=36813 RepID=UPI003CE78EFB
MPESLDSLLSSFRRSLRVEGKADRTIVIYCQGITFFGRWLESQGLAPDVSNLTRENVLAWMDSLRDRGQQSSTISTRWKGMRRFVNWLLNEDIIRRDPLKGITVEQPEAPSVPVLSDEELTAIIAACRGKTFNDRRDEAVIRILIDCGLRISEVVGADLVDLDLDAETLIVTGKGSRVRPVYFGVKAGQALDRYLRVRAQHRHASNPALFLGERGRFTDDGARKRVKLRAEMAGLDPKVVHPHQFRHTHAHDFLMAGGQERDLKRLMGWRSDTMLERYGASAADHRAREAARRLKRGDRI